MLTRPMDASSDGRTRAPARLLIHTTGEAMRSLRSRGALGLRALRQRLRHWGQGAPIRLWVDDMSGRRVLELEDAGPVVDLPLEPGTYQVTVRRGALCRSYTLTLQGNTCFDLYLSLADALA